jgi:hypothetical protein
MKPDHYEEDFLVIDGALDPSIFPPGISHGLNVLSPGEYDRFSIFNPGSNCSLFTFYRYPYDNACLQRQWHQPADMLFEELR